jgi:hypothetical protein
MDTTQTGSDWNLELAHTSIHFSVHHMVIREQAGREALGRRVPAHRRLEAGGVLVGDRIDIDIEVEAVRSKEKRAA